MTKTKTLPRPARAALAFAAWLAVYAALFAWLGGLVAAPVMLIATAVGWLWAGRRSLSAGHRRGLLGMLAFGCAFAIPVLLGERRAGPWLLNFGVTLLINLLFAAGLVLAASAGVRTAGERR